jgi:aspartate ammonia-lyase
VGRQWIFEYTLALAKEMLGYVRGKYSSIPIPNADVTLNQSDLISAATTEKAALVEKLRGYFYQTSRKSLLERRAQETEFKQTELQQVPYTIYIG